MATTQLNRAGIECESHCSDIHILIDLLSDDMRKSGKSAGQTWGRVADLYRIRSCLIEAVRVNRKIGTEEVEAYLDEAR